MQFNYRWSQISRMVVFSRCAYCWCVLRQDIGNASNQRHLSVNR